MPGFGEPRRGLCWYCGKATLLDDDPPEHIIPAAIGGTLTTTKVCFGCNQRASRELDQPFLNEWFIALARNAYEVATRRGRRPPQPRHQAMLPNRTRVAIDFWQGAWKPEVLPDVHPTEDGYHIRAANVEAAERIQRDLERKMAPHQSLRQVTVTRASASSEVQVAITLRPALWLRMATKLALGAASLVWQDTWLQTAAGARHLATLWSDPPTDRQGRALGTVPTFQPGTFKYLATPPEHLLFFVNNARATTCVAYLFGSHAVSTDMSREGQPPPGTAWMMDGRGGAPKWTTFDEIATEAAVRAVDSTSAAES